MKTYEERKKETCTALSHEDYEAELRAEIAALRQALTAIAEVPATIPEVESHYDLGKLEAWRNAAAMAQSALNQRTHLIKPGDMIPRVILEVSRDKLLEAQRHTGLNYSDLIARIDMVLGDVKR